VFRSENASRYFIAFNNLQATDTKQEFALRGSTNHVVIYANVLDRWSHSNHDPNSSPEALVHHHVWDSNLFVGRSDTAYENEYGYNGTALALAAEDVLVRNNVFYGYQRGIDMNDHELGAGVRVKMQHNTMVCYYQSQCQLVRSIAPSEDLELFGNLLLQTSGSGSGGRLLETQASEWPGTTDYNIVFGELWDSTAATHDVGGQRITLEEFQEAHGGDLHSLRSDPLLTSVVVDEQDTAEPSFLTRQLRGAGFVTPSAASPARDAAPRTGNALDFYGRLRDEMPDIGAVEYAP
jgi:hypothetical protein